MNKAKNIFIGVLVIIVVGIGCVLLIHNSWTDRVNPFIPETTSYAKVQKGTQSYNNVQAIDPKTSKNLSYKIDHVGGYDPSRGYISIDHKGQYVRSINYISKKEFDAVKNPN